MNLFFKDLFDYNQYCNQKVCAVFIENSNQISKKSIELFSHILNAHHIWNHRIQPNQIIYKVWEIHPVDELHSIDNLNHEKTFSLLEQCDLNEIIDYKNSRANQFQNNIQNVLFHIINHSTYHRGQLAKEFRSCGIEPINTDYIFYKR